MPAEVRVHPAAEQELRSAYLWYLERSPVVADAFQLEVDHAVTIVAEAPDRWPRLTETARCYVFPRFPFALVYRKLRQYVEIIAAAHQKRKPGYWIDR